MYGIIHQSFKAMMLQSYGKQIWQSIVKKMEITRDSFNPLEKYDDEIVSRMLKISASEVGIPESELLFDLGYHFMTLTIRNNYKGMLRFYGSDVLSLLKNLNNMHAGLQSIFTGYQPPTFEVRDVTASSCVLIYCSHREDFGSFLMGVLKGLAELYDENISIESLISPQSEKERSFALYWNKQIAC